MNFFKKLGMVTSMKANKALDNHLSIDERFAITEKNIKEKMMVSIEKISEAIAAKDRLAAAAKKLPDGDAKNSMLEKVALANERIEEAKLNVQKLDEKIEHLHETRDVYVAQIDATKAIKETMVALNGLGLNDDEFSLNDTVKKAEDEIIKINAEIEAMSILD